MAKAAQLPGRIQVSDCSLRLSILSFTVQLSDTDGAAVKVGSTIPRERPCEVYRQKTKVEGEHVSVQVIILSADDLMRAVEPAVLDT